MKLRWNAAALVEDGDCAQDRFLNWGDLAMIPERPHPLNVPPAGIRGDIAVKIIHCLNRQVSVTAGDRKKIVSLQLPDNSFGGRPRETRHLFFRLKTVLLESQLLLSTSDLTCVQVKRIDPVTGEPLELTVNLETLEDPQRDFWVRDGDVIEVPEK